MIEVEVKAQVDNPKETERSIISSGATPIGIENQVDTYYNSPLKNFKDTDEALRIRVHGKGSLLTYKGPKLDTISKTREEYEVEISDANDMGDILSSLGFDPVMTIVKRRKKFRLGDFYISLDNVRNLGNFLEVEIFTDDSRMYNEKVESIFKFIKKLGLKRESTVRESYLEMMLKK